MNDFDMAARRALRDDASGHVRWLLPGLPTTLRFSRLLDSQSAPRPGEPDRRCDTLMELTHEEGLGPPWVAVVEVFTASEADADDRLLEYISRFRRELRHGPHERDRYHFVGVMLFVTEGPERCGINDDLPGGDSLLLFRPRLIRLMREDAAAHLAAVEESRQGVAILVWVPLMKQGATPEVIQCWKSLVCSREGDEQRRRDIAGLTLVFADLAGFLEVWEQALEEFIVKESTVLKRERLEGLQEGRLEGERRALLRVLKARFGDVSVVASRIAAENRLEELERWLDLALNAGDLDVFRAALDL